MDPFQRHGQEMTAKYATLNAIAVLRACDQVFAEMPIYIMHKTLGNACVLPSCLADARGWTGFSLDSQCRSYLESVGEWRGPGFAMIYNDGVYSLTDASFFETVIHEAAHFVAWFIDQRAAHGPLWIRSVLHLVHRANRLLPSDQAKLTLSGTMPMTNYARSSAYKYDSAIAAELTEVDKSVLWHLRQSPPLAFQEIVNDDDRRNGWPLSYPTAPNGIAATPIAAVRRDATSPVPAPESPRRPKRHTHFINGRMVFLSSAESSALIRKRIAESAEEVFDDDCDDDDNDNYGLPLPAPFSRCEPMNQRAFNGRLMF